MEIRREVLNADDQSENEKDNDEAHAPLPRTDRNRRPPKDPAIPVIQLRGEPKPATNSRLLRF